MKPTLLLSALLVSSAFAGEIKVIRAPFTISVKFPVTLIPEKGAVEVTDSAGMALGENVTDGTALKKGDVIARIDTEVVSRELKNLRNPQYVTSDNNELKEKRIKALEEYLKHPEILAPADGIWSFWGNGSRLLGTFLAKETQYVPEGSLRDSNTRLLSAGMEGRVLLPGREEIDIPAKVETVEVSSDENIADISLSASFPPDTFLRPGMRATAVIIVYHKEDAIALPADAVSYHPQGWCVEVKLADGTKELRPVKRGREGNGKIEILSGLEPGQVVIVP